MKQKLVRTAINALIPISLLTALLLLTNPYHLPLVFLVLPFILFFMVVYQGSLFITRSFFKGSDRRHRFNAAILAGGLITLMLLQSIRQLSIRDLIIIILLILGLTFYVRRIDI